MILLLQQMQIGRNADLTQVRVAQLQNFSEFMEQIERQRAEAQERRLGDVERDAAADGGHKPAQWILERRHDMIATVKQEVSGPNGGAIKHEVNDAKERLLAKLAGLAARIEQDDVS